MDMHSISIVDEEKPVYTDNGIDNELPPTVIKVIGCGGGGSNAVNRMIEAKIKGVEFIAINTDLQALKRSNAKKRIPIGQKVTKGLGAGGHPEIGEQAAEEDKEIITNELRGADMVFITAGMGGGTGTGSAPVVARIARELGALTVAVVTTPFDFESPVRMRRAKEGLKKLHEYVDSLIVIPNEKLNSILEKNGTDSFTDACLIADDVLRQGVQGISEIITLPGIINTDFADVKNAMQGKGNAIFGIGVSEGENRAVEAATAAINNPMLENSNIYGATNILINICASNKVSLSEINEIVGIITASADKDHEVCWGQVLLPEMEGKIRVTVIATGFENKKPEVAEPVVEPVVEKPVVRDANVIDTKEFSDILKNTTGRTSNGMGGMNSLNVFGEIPAAADNAFQDNSGTFSQGNLNSANSYGRFTAASVNNGIQEEKSENQETKREAWGGALFDKDSQSLYERHGLKNFGPPQGFEVDPNDLSKPAIWNNNFGKTISLSDD